MLRAVLLVHRWLGVFIGVLMTMWCLSGFVMMYSDYPRLLPAEQLRGLSPLQPPDRAVWSRIDLPTETPLASVRLEMLADRPVLRVTPALDPSRPIAQMRRTSGAFDLTTGRPLEVLTAEQARQVGERFASAFAIDGHAFAANQTGMDQWTVQAFRRNQPLYRVDYDDPAGSTIYVAGPTGEVVQQTTRAERFWGWLGAVPHWLYPTLLRQNGELWSQVVIWTSLVGCFLTVTGLWIGLARLRKKPTGGVGSPYRGLWWWHHMTGLFFGLLTLTWVASGLFSMNPWGFLDSMAGFAERQRLAGPMRWSEVRAALEHLDTLPPGVVRIDSAPLAGKTFLVSIAGDGQMRRLDGQGRAAPLNRQAVVAALAGEPKLASLDLIQREDAYYYAHKFPVKLPAWRATLTDAEQTRLYIDPDSGQLIRAFDRNGRRFRWLQDGLHSLDLPGIRARPLWDLLVLPLLAMVTTVCATGAWLGIRKAGRDLRGLRRGFGRFRRRQA